MPQGEDLAAIDGVAQKLADLGDQLLRVEPAALAPGAILVEAGEFALEFLDRGIELVGGVLGFGAERPGALDRLGLLGFEVAQLLAQALLARDVGGEGGLGVLGSMRR
jgi:hypothetical protein